MIGKNGEHTQGSRIMSLINDWQEDDVDWAHDCAIVSQYYSGDVAETEEDQDTLGLVDHANYRVGKETIEKARDETLAAFTKPHRLATIKYYDFDGTPVEKKSAESRVTKVVDQLLRDWDLSFAHEFAQMVDRHVMHGDAVMMFPPEDEGWRPFNARIITDRDAPQNTQDDNFARWAVYSDLQIGEALTSIAKERDGWMTGAKQFIKGLWERRYDGIDSKSGLGASFVSTFDDMFSMVEHISPEEWATNGETGKNLCEFYNSRFRVFYYYQKDFSNPEEGIPVDLYIVARVQPRFNGEEDTSWYKGDPLLYARKGAYEKVEHAIVDFVLDTKLGVDHPTWSTIGGLGHTNYNADRFSNLLMSSMVNHAIDMNTQLYEIGDAADHREIEKFIKEGYQANSIIPAGASYVDKSKSGGSIGDTITAISFLRQQANSSAVGHTGRSLASPDELRVNAVDRQQQDLRTASNRGVLFARKLRILVQEIVRRLAREIEFGEYFGRQEKQVQRLIKELKRQNVDLLYFTEENINVSYSKLTGDGDPQQRRARVNEMVARIGLVPAEARNDVLRAWFAEVMDDWELADEVYENAEELEPGQQERAISKAADMMRLGIPQVVTKEDVPETQLQTLLPILDGMAQRATAAGAFGSQEELTGFMAIGQYAARLASTLDQRGQKDLANQFMAELQRISTMAQGPANNLQRQQESQQDPKLLIDQGKLDLSVRNQALKEAEFGYRQQKDATVQQAKDRQQGFNEFVQSRRVLTEEERLQLDRLNAERDRADKELERFERNFQ